MRFAVLLHRAHENRLRVETEHVGGGTRFLLVKSTRAMRRLRYRMVHRETRIPALSAAVLGAAAGLLDDDLVADPPIHRFEKGHG
jgi:hypothetical protein